MTDKPQPPDDSYEVMLGKDVPRPLPAKFMSWYGQIWDHRESRMYKVFDLAPTKWYAVPKSSLPAKEPVKPTPPPGYKLVTVEEMPLPVPEGTMVTTALFGKRCSWWRSANIGDSNKNNLIETLIYAIPDTPNVKESLPVQPDADGWIPHTPGDPCPCDPELEVEIKCRDGSTSSYVREAGGWNWSAHGGGTGLHKEREIIAWRSHKPTPAADAAHKATGLDPKKEAGEKKPQLQLIPAALNAELAKALQNGAEKYGAWNWRENNVELMTYIGAMRRHLDDFVEGEDHAPDSGVHHLGHVAANCAILLDAFKHETLVDNRPQSKQPS